MKQPHWAGFRHMLVLAVGFVGVGILLSRAGWNGMGVLCFAGTVVAGIIGLMRYYSAFEVVSELAGVQVGFLLERPTTWSTHFRGWPAAFWRDLPWWVMGRRPEGCKLLDQRNKEAYQRDRQELRRLALQAFEDKLDAEANTPGAVIISASYLNDPKRDDRRLAERIDILKTKPDWCYAIILRTMSPFDSVPARLLFAWRPREGESFWRPQVPGVIAWRAVDKEPRFDDLKAHVQTGDVLQ